MQNPTEDVCTISIIHGDVVDRVRSVLPEDGLLHQMADLFKVVGDPTRARILFALRESEMCVCDIAALLGMTASAISHQLRVLKQAALVKHRKEGKVVFYSLKDAHIQEILDLGMVHVLEDRIPSALPREKG